MYIFTTVILVVFRISQLELKQQLEGLAEELKKIAAEQNCPLALEAYTNKLTNARNKITVVSNILQTAQVLKLETAYVLYICECDAYASLEI